MKRGHFKWYTLSNVISSLCVHRNFYKYTSNNWFFSCPFIFCVSWLSKVEQFRCPHPWNANHNYETRLPMLIKLKEIREKPRILMKLTKGSCSKSVTHTLSNRNTSKNILKNDRYIWGNAIASPFDYFQGSLPNLEFQHMILFLFQNSSWGTTRQVLVCPSNFSATHSFLVFVFPNLYLFLSSLF